ncbi:hypothetical protein ABMY26_06665 (plasmid) [Azospirillum sp. HJ39]|uniref:hypothetical protein n=1 Tax=Azospirillum sp. HJ39 TaxID=3159496 RepID=UPI0035591E13
MTHLIEALHLWAVNTGEIHPQRRQIELELAKSHVTGKYTRDDAIKAFLPWVRKAADSFIKSEPDADRPGNSTIRELAARMAKEFEDDVKGGHYGDFTDETAHVLKYMTKSGSIVTASDLREKLTEAGVGNEVEVSKYLYWYFMEVLPPVAMPFWFQNRRCDFGFAEGAEAIVAFREDDLEHRYFATLTDKMNRA